MPYCCGDGELFDNQCYAECGRYDISTDCVQTDECESTVSMPSRAVIIPIVVVHVVSFFMALYAIC